MESIVLEKDTQVDEELILDPKELQCDSPRGTILILADGNEWHVRSLPLGAKGNKLRGLMKKVNDLEFKIKKEFVIDEYLSAADDMCYEALRLNYPKLTREMFDKASLVDMEDIHRFISCVTGQSAIEVFVQKKINEVS